MTTDPIDKLNVLHPVSGDGEQASRPGCAYPSGSAEGAGVGHTPAGPAAPVQNPAGRVLVRRDVFWNNVVRDILMAMASAAASSSGRLKPTVTGAETSTSPIDEMFDGRVGLMTTLGQRIPIADIYPVFSCSAVHPGADRSLATDVQCTVFRIKTPTGESYTLPISQIVGVHSLSNELVEQLETEAEAMNEVDTDHIDKAPFGFAAYTSLARAERQDDETGSEESENSDQDTE